MGDAWHYSTHGSAALVINPAGSLDGQVRSVTHDAKGTTVRQGGPKSDGAHVYNGFILPLPTPTRIEDDNPILRGITITLKATQNTWIEWMQVWHGEAKIFENVYGANLTGTGANIDAARLITIDEGLNGINPKQGIVAWLAIGFKSPNGGEIRLINGELKCEK